jgi:hypothetical protein
MMLAAPLAAARYRASGLVLWPKSEAPQWPPRGRFRIKTGSAARLDPCGDH